MQIRKACKRAKALIIDYNYTTANRLRIGGCPWKCTLEETECIMYRQLFIKKTYLYVHWS